MRRLSVFFFAAALLLAGITVAALLVRAGVIAPGGAAVMADDRAPDSRDAAAGLPAGSASES